MPAFQPPDEPYRHNGRRVNEGLFKNEKLIRALRYFETIVQGWLDLLPNGVNIVIECYALHECRRAWVSTAAIEKPANAPASNDYD
jgi:hypothetical protein